MQYSHGDLWEFPADFRVITTNGIIKGDGTAVMGKGVAKQAADKYPGLPTDLAEHLRQNRNVLGYFPQYGIVTLPTKDHWKHKSSLILIEDGCRALAALALVLSDSTFVMVPPGIGAGGRTWAEVEPIVDAQLADIDNVTILLPEGIQMQRKKRISDYVQNVRGNNWAGVDVYIGRTNPRIPEGMSGRNGAFGNPIPLEEDTDGARKLCLVQYWDWLNSDDPQAVQVREWIPLLKGKTLGCWCHPKLCHGHVLARLANDPNGWAYCEETTDGFRKELAQ